MTTGRAAHDGIVDQHYALAVYNVADGIELDPDALCALTLFRRDKGTGDILVLGKADRVGDS